MDVLSDTLSVVRLTGAVFFTARLSSPWAAVSPPPQELARSLQLPSDCIAMFHILVDGHCWVRLDDHGSLELEAGDVIIFPHGDSHVIGNTRGIAPQPLTAFLPLAPQEGIPRIEDGGIGRPTHLVCGYLHCDQRFNPLMGALPRLILVRTTSDAGTVSPLSEDTPVTPEVVQIVAGDWLRQTLQYTIAEAVGPRSGSAAMLARLTEILFVDVLRRYMEQFPPSRTGWLAGVNDPIVGQALRLLHAHPEHAWTVDDLARAGAVSRSTLAQRFVALIGESPMRYLAGWRMQLAKHLLRQTTWSVAQVAQHVGYESEAAFNRAFKRHTNQPPAAWRVSEVAMRY